ncbi:hypothetical protein [Acinetobacter seifertii]|uniref:Uncharacterized protein n=2 Tax=Acinetobacter seifertii TaxID=1530123 RepID=A0A7H2PWT8_9GAMM|nr:hypothetical protein IC796_03940 [Acinetobacter seifertii]
MFIDTNGEMSFVYNERLKFIMHYLKQGADDSLVEMKDGRFVREDSELSFTEIWLPAAEHQQRKIDEQQAKVEELQTLYTQQGINMLKLQTLYTQQGINMLKLQKRVDAQTKHVEMALLAVKDIYKSAIDEFHNWDVFNEKEPKLCEHLQNLSVAAGELEQALKGEE